MDEAKTQVSPSDIQPTTNNTIKPGFLNQKGNLLLIVSVIFFIVVVGVVPYILGSRNNKIPNAQQSQQINQPSPTSINNQPSITSVNTNPKLVTFMRKGDIFIKNFTTNKELKVSKTSPVDTPHLSYDGKYVSYFHLIHGGNGFPTSDIYVTDTQSGYEANIGVGNPASRITWAKDGNYVGLISYFTDGKPTMAILYDPVLKKNILEQKVSKDAYGGSALTTDKSYNVSLPCATLEQKYVTFCKEYESVLNKDLVRSDTAYKFEDYSKSNYAKPNYKLTKSQKLPNGLVVLEFYTGEPQNPESKWGIGGGVFIPGYDEGVTQTYSLLIDEATGKTIQELPLAVDTNWVF